MPELPEGVPRGGDTVAAAEREGFIVLQLGVLSVRVFVGFEGHQRVFFQLEPVLAAVPLPLEGVLESEEGELDLL